MFDNMEISERLGLSGGGHFTDTNNNSANNNKGDKKGLDKYSLRPRSCRKRTHHAEAPDEDDGALVIKKTAGGGRQCKPKQKPAPLSKYRRKTANARERSRMKEINQAFETLRKAVPQLSVTHQPINEKLTKITTLRLAMKYISTLSATLTGGGNGGGNGSDVSLDGTTTSLSDYSDLDCLLLESDDCESLPLCQSTSDFSDEHSLTPADFSLTVDFEDSLTAPVDFDRLSVGEPVDDLGVMLVGDGGFGEFDPFLAGFS